jgi:hypothetical protein
MGSGDDASMTAKKKKHRPLCSFIQLPLVSLPRLTMSVGVNEPWKEELVCPEANHLSRGT